MNQMFFGNARVMLFTPNSGSTPPAIPSPYFAYDENRVITGLYQGSPNIFVEGESIDHFTQEPYQYSGWEYGGSNVVDNYAMAIGNNAFDDTLWNEYQMPPSKGVTGSLSFPNVTYIGSGAFYNSIPTNITIGSNIQTIGAYAFTSSQIYEANIITLTIGKDMSWCESNNYSQWGLSFGSTIVCTDGTITI